MTEPALVAARRARPTLLFVLALAGVVLGGFGAMHSIMSGTVLLGTRDAMVRAYRDSAAKESTPLATAADLELMAEREADVIYNRRNAQLPLHAINLIISCLLFAGCSRALRGQAWGAAAWSLAATVAIPYQVIDAALTLMQARELHDAFVTLPKPLNVLRLTLLDVGTMFWIFVGVAEVLYFAGCLFYLRRPSVRALFSDGAGRTRPSA